MEGKNENTEKIKTALEDQLKRQLQYGLSQGMFAACKVIHDKATDQSMSAEDRLNDIINFCEPLLNVKGA